MADGEPRVAERLAFFGSLTAGLSHDLKNVLATINEHAGLLEDLQAFARPDRPLAPEKIQEVCAHITAQVARGHKMLGRLSRVSHSVDHDRASVDVNALVECALSANALRTCAGLPSSVASGRIPSPWSWTLWH
jgi:signal transduction histidine kinase